LETHKLPLCAVIPFATKVLENGKRFSASIPIRPNPNGMPLYGPRLKRFWHGCRNRKNVVLGEMLFKQFKSPFCQSPPSKNTP